MSPVSLGVVLYEMAREGCRFLAGVRRSFSRRSSRTTQSRAEVYARRGEVDRAFEWLERAYAQRDSGLSQIISDPHFKRLERDPRYAALLEKMRLPL